MSKNVLPDPRPLANRYRSGVTSNQKPITFRHLEHPDLMIASRGSYTYAKDIPYIGRVVTEVLHGTETQSQLDWSESSANKCLSNQPSLYMDLSYGDPELEVSRDQRVKAWKREHTD